MTMPRIELEIRLVSDAIFTASGATTSAETLSYIPGTALLGVVAARSYSRFVAMKLSYEVFHSGRVRFGPGYPIVDEERTLPTPLAWHTFKGEKVEKEGSLLSEGIRNVSRMNDEERREHSKQGRQLEQIRDRFFTDSGRVAQLDTQVSMKTALDFERRLRARDQHLFVYESLPAGSRFRAFIDIDDALPTEVCKLLVEALAGENAWFGRSRSAEYGEATMRILPATSPPVSSSSTGGDDLHLFYCCSGLAIVDATTGLPALLPRAIDLGLPQGAVFDPAYSFVRVRRYAPFNSKRMSPTYQRQVLQAGSVLAYRSGHTRTGSGTFHLGAHQAEGLGEIVYNPWFLERQSIAFIHKTAPAASVVRTPMERPRGELAEWLTESLEERRAEERVSKEVETFVLAKLRVFLGKGKPTRSQWGEIRRLARGAKDPKALADLLFRDPHRDERDRRDDEGGYCNKGTSKERWRTDNAGSPGYELRNFLSKAMWRDKRDGCVAVMQLAERIQRKIGDENQRRGR